MSRIIHLCRRTAPIGGAATLCCLLLFTPSLSAADDRPTPSPSSTMVQEEQKDLPSADELIARHIEAVGGEEKLREIKHLTMKGRMEFVGMGISGPVRTYASAPHYSYTEMEFQGVGSILQGFDGTHAWLIEPMSGPMLLDGATLAQTRRDSDFYKQLEMERWYPERRTVEKTTFEDQPVYEVEMTTESGEVFTFYYHRETGLQIGMSGSMHSPMGEAKTTTILNAYRDVGGMKIPHEVTTRVMHIQQKLTIEEVSTDEIDASRYELPRPIRTLVRESEKAAGENTEGSDDD